MPRFTHLHVHSHYSLLDGMSKVPDIVDKCIANNMYSVALTDHGVMFGMKEFHDYVGKYNGKIKGKIKEQKEILAKEDATDEEKETATSEISKLNGTFFKPIFGVEAYCARRTLYDHDATIKSIDPETGRASVLDRSGWHLILLAKNKTGYFNLCKLVSISWIDGYYGKPRIDKNVLAQYHEGIICSSACLGGEIEQLLIANKIEEAEKSVMWFKELFGDDYYLEIMRHPTTPDNPAHDVWDRQQEVNPLLIELARKTNTKIICTNDSHFLEAEHAEAHERLLCLSTGKKMSDADRLHYTKQEWLKTPDEMAELFSDMPETLENTMEIVDKVENIVLDSGPIMPKFEIPEEFGTEEEYRKKLTEEDLFNEFTRDENGNVVLSKEDADKKIERLGGYNKLYRIKLEADYLNKLAWEGADKRYGEALHEDTDKGREMRERITFELHIMKTMGFPGYFLIVMDYIRAAREELDVWVGPGRGSAAGSVVAYCLWITDVDPLKYDLLFERFLNPDRISLPDIDVDFADDGREKVLAWVTQKYGAEKVAHIITYGTMATKSSISDVGRVQDVPLPVVKQMTSLVPDKFDESLADPKTKKVPKVNLKNCLKYVPGLVEALEGPDENVSSMLRYARELENTVRQTGIHACGVIIGADDLTKFAPMAVVEDKAAGGKVQVTQYDGHYVESVGLIKMDFLGLITLSIMKEAVKNIREHTGDIVDIFSVPNDDPEVYKLYSEGRTIGIFQFESPGMQKHLRALKPTVFEDLIAMNALYRPGPMDYIPSFIDRKQGREPITYDLPEMEVYLKDTYGVTVYQEQVMLLSRLLAGFTRGESDKLRKAMGKKLINVLNELKPKFVNQGAANGHDPKILEKIWADWEKFASYAFNKSHATCYSWVSYQTAWLKCHYPAEYMAAMLTSCKDTITEVSKYMDECKAMGLSVNGPNVNESTLNFSVAKTGAVVFGLSGVKGVGESAVEAIIEAREKGGVFKDVYDFVERVNLTACNRKAIESLALAGAFDQLGIKREHFFVVVNPKGQTFSEILCQYGNSYQQDKERNRESLFGDMFDTVEIAKPEFPNITMWTDLERLNREKEVVGIYLSAHPLDMYKFEMKYVMNTKLTELSEDNLQNMIGRNFITGGIVKDVRNGTSKKGEPFLIATIEDREGTGELPLFGKDYAMYANFFTPNAYICIQGNVVKNEWNDRLRKNITKVMYMPELLKLINFKALTISIDAEIVDNTLVDKLKSVLILNRAVRDSVEQGPKLLPVSVRIVDEASTYSVDMVSRAYSVELSKNIMDFIESTPGLSMELA